MAKKFDNLTVNPVYNELAEATKGATPKEKSNTETTEPTKKKRKERKTYCKLEAEESKNSLKTSGKKGVKLPRINLAFTPNNYEYIKVMSKVRGESLTEFVNNILDNSRQENKEIYYKALEFREAYNLDKQKGNNEE